LLHVINKYALFLIFRVTFVIKPLTANQGSVLVSGQDDIGGPAATAADATPTPDRWWPGRSCGPAHRAYSRQRAGS